MSERTSQQLEKVALHSQSASEHEAVVSRLQAQLSEMESSYRQAKGVRAGLEAEVRAARGELEAAREEIERSRGAADAKVAEREKALEAKEKEAQQWRAKWKAQANDAAETSAKLLAAEKRLLSDAADHAAVLAAKDARLGELETQLESGRPQEQQVLSFAREQAKRDEEVSRLRGQLKSLREMLRESHKVLKHLMRQEALLKDELTEARRSNERADSLNVDYLKNGKTRNSGGQGAHVRPSPPSPPCLRCLAASLSPPLSVRDAVPCSLWASPSLTLTLTLTLTRPVLNLVLTLGLAIRSARRLHHQSVRRRRRRGAHQARARAADHPQVLARRHGPSRREDRLLRAVVVAPHRESAQGGLGGGRRTVRRLDGRERFELVWRMVWRRLGAALRTGDRAAVIFRRVVAGGPDLRPPRRVRVPPGAGATRAGPSRACRDAKAAEGGVGWLVWRRRLGAAWGGGRAAAYRR